LFLRDQPVAPRPATTPQLGLLDGDDAWVLASAVLAQADLFVTGDQEVLACGLSCSKQGHRPAHPVPQLTPEGDKPSGSAQPGLILLSSITPGEASLRRGRSVIALTDTGGRNSQSSTIGTGRTMATRMCWYRAVLPAMLGFCWSLPALASPAPRLLPTISSLRAPNPLTTRPPIRLLNTVVPAPSQADRSSRFPLRREGGGTRAACASRLVAHLVPETGVLEGDSQGLIGLIEGSIPQPVDLVLRLPSGTWLAAPNPSASVRLFQQPQPLQEGIWESFPGCEGSEDPVAPPARSLLLPASRQLELPHQETLQRLWRSCGQAVPTRDVLRGWSYGHLADQLPAELPVICERLPQARASGG
jgi:hypothetical protein